MSDVLIVRQPILEDNNPVFFGLLSDAFGQMLTTASVSTNGVTLTVFDDADPTFTYSITGLNPLTSYDGHQLMFDTPQSSGWNKGGDGYNFVYLAHVNLLPDGGTVGSRTYRWEFKFDLVSGIGGGSAWALYETPIIPVLTS